MGDLFITVFAQHLAGLAVEKEEGLPAATTGDHDHVTFDHWRHRIAPRLDALGVVLAAVFRLDVVAPHHLAVLGRQAAQAQVGAEHIHMVADDGRGRTRAVAIAFEDGLAEWRCPHFLAGGDVEGDAGLFLVALREDVAAIAHHRHHTETFAHRDLPGHLGAVSRPGGEDLLIGLAVAIRATVLRPVGGRCHHECGTDGEG